MRFDKNWQPVLQKPMLWNTRRDTSLFAEVPRSQPAFERMPILANKADDVSHLGYASGFLCKKAQAVSCCGENL
jgi:hypothetical protein